MADAGGEKTVRPSDLLEQQHEQRIADREAARAAKAKEKKAKSPEVAGRQRLDQLAALMKRGKEAWDAGVKTAKEVAVKAKEKVTEAAVAVAGAPEWAQEKVDNLVDGYGRKSIDFQRGVEALDDWIADRAEGALAKVTGGVEAAGIGIKAGVSEAKGKYNAAKEQRLAKKAEDGNKAIKLRLETTKALIAKLEASQARDEATLAGRQEADLAGSEAAGERSKELHDVAADYRQEASDRKGNGQSLTGFRQGLGEFIRPDIKLEA